MIKNAELVSHQIENNKATLTLNVPADLCYFPDHFAEFPLLPGVVQIDWAARYTLQFFAVSGHCQKMEQIKFQAVIRPGDTVSLTLEWDSPKQRVSFSYDSTRGRHASGRLVFVSGAI